MRFAWLSLVLYVSVASLAEGQRRTPPPWAGSIPPSIAVVSLGQGFAEPSRVVADLILARLERITTREQLGLVTDQTVQSVRPNGRRTSYDVHRDEQELAALARAAVLVDVQVVDAWGPQVVARAVAHYASKGTPPDTLPLIFGRSTADVANRLAQHLITATVPRATRTVYGREWQLRGCPVALGPYEWYEVDEPALLVDTGSARPRPSRGGMLASRRMPPRFAAAFVIDTSGRMMAGSLELDAIPSPAAGDSARAAAVRWRFRPARLAGCTVREAVDVDLFSVPVEPPDTGAITTAPDLEGRVERVKIEEGIMPGGYRSQLVLWLAIPPSATPSAGVVMGRPGPVFVQYGGRRAAAIDRDSIQIGDRIKVWRRDGAASGSVQAPPGAPSYSARQIVIVR